MAVCSHGCLGRSRKPSEERVTTTNAAPGVADIIAKTTQQPKSLFCGAQLLRSSDVLGTTPRMPAGEGAGPMCCSPDAGAIACSHTSKFQTDAMSSIVEEPSEGSNPEIGEDDNMKGDECLSASLRRRRKSSLSDLEKLKALAGRLGLSVRRPSYANWLRGLPSREVCDARDEDEEGDGTDFSSDSNTLPLEDEDRSCRIAQVDRSLKDVRAQLVQMQQTDQELAKRFVSLRHDVQQLRLRHTQLRYEDLLDEAAAQLTANGSSRSEELLANDDMPLMRHLDGVSAGMLGCDADSQEDALSQLVSIGITKMNLLERRFSVF